MRGITSFPDEISFSSSLLRYLQKHFRATWGSSVKANIMPIKSNHICNYTPIRSQNSLVTPHNVMISLISTVSTLCHLCSSRRSTILFWGLWSNVVGSEGSISGFSEVQKLNNSFPNTDFQHVPRSIYTYIHLVSTSWRWEPSLYILFWLVSGQLQICSFQSNHRLGYRVFNPEDSLLIFLISRKTIAAATIWRGSLNDDRLGRL